MMSTYNDVRPASLLVPEVDTPDLAVSVIVPAHNEEHYIGACLASLFGQTLDPATFEVIVIDDGSTDKTIAVVRKFPQVRLLTQKHGGPANARNLGATKARGRILAFLDADMTFAPDFVEKLIRPIERGEVVGTFSTDEYVANADNLWARSWNVCYYLPQGRRVPEGAVDEAGTVFRAIARDPFFRVGGFDSTGYHDDHTVAAKLGIAAVRVPGAVCYHANPASAGEVFASAHWIGKSDKQTFHPQRDSAALSTGRAQTWHRPRH